MSKFAPDHHLWFLLLEDQSLAILRLPPAPCSYRSQNPYIHNLNPILASLSFFFTPLHAFRLIPSVLIHRPTSSPLLSPPAGICSPATVQAPKISLKQTDFQTRMVSTEMEIYLITAELKKRMK